MEFIKFFEIGQRLNAGGIKDPVCGHHLRAPVAFGLAKWEPTMTALFDN